MSFAKTFIEQLRSGNTDEAISTLKEAMSEKFEDSKKEIETGVFESYGFSVKEAKEDDKEPEDKDDKDDKDKDKDPENNDDDNKEDEGKE